MSLREKESKTVCVTEEAEPVLRELLLEDCEFLEQHEEAKLKQIKEFRKLVRSGASVEALAKHPLWPEQKYNEWIDGAELLAIVHGDRWRRQR
jgi:hypothetical protein